VANDALPVIGWREWAGLPDLAVARVKAKVDTGARSSALHAFDLHVTRRRGREIVRFRIHPLQRDARVAVEAEAEVAEYRTVKNSAGMRTRRPVIRTLLELGGACWPIELTLVGRDEMGFRMLLGREAVRGRFVVDPSRSFLRGRAPSARRKGPGGRAPSAPGKKRKERR
jgi:hypothetical protein